jgi:hypothetical protein
MGTGCGGGLRGCEDKKTGTLTEVTVAMTMQVRTRLCGSEDSPGLDSTVTRFSDLGSAAGCSTGASVSASGARRQPWGRERCWGRELDAKWLRWAPGRTTEKERVRWGRGGEEPRCRICASAAVCLGCSC